MNCTALPCASGTALLDLTLEHDALQHHILCLSACLPACGGELDIHATAMTWLPSPCSMSRQLPHLLMQDPPHRQLPASPQPAPAAPRQQQMPVPKADTDTDIGTDTDLDGTHRMRPASYGGPRTSSAPSAAPAPCSGWHVGAHWPCRLVKAQPSCGLPVWLAEHRRSRSQRDAAGYYPSTWCTWTWFCTQGPAHLHTQLTSARHKPAPTTSPEAVASSKKCLPTG